MKNNDVKLTKWCLYPWYFMQIAAGGLIQPCCVGVDSDMGDLFVDFLENDDKDYDFCNSEGLQNLREGLLTGNLRPMCQNCFNVSNQLITTDEFKNRLVNYFSQKNIQATGLSNADLKSTYAYDWVAISFTNKCNLECIYCVQSLSKNSNPYLKAEIPYERTHKILDKIVSMGIRKMTTCVEGEATIYSHWYDVFSQFKAEHPQIELIMTTNLNREYSEKEIDLLVDYSVLDISIDSLNPDLYSQIRKNGRINLLLKNLDKINERAKERGIKGPEITLHIVVCDATYKEIETLADYAFDKGYGIQLGNYEERANTVAYRDKLLKPVTQLPKEELNEITQILQRILKKAEKNHSKVIIQGDIDKFVKSKGIKNSNRFQPYNDNPIIEVFCNKYPNGTDSIHTDVLYDADNISHEGISIAKGSELTIDGLDNTSSITIREVHQYKDGTTSNRYGQKVVLRYRKKIYIQNGTFTYRPDYNNENIKKILLEITDWSNK